MHWIKALGDAEVQGHGTLELSPPDRFQDAAQLRPRDFFVTDLSPSLSPSEKRGDLRSPFLVTSHLLGLQRLDLAVKQARVWRMFMLRPRTRRNRARQDDCHDAGRLP